MYVSDTYWTHDRETMGKLLTGRGMRGAPKRSISHLGEAIIITKEGGPIHLKAGEPLPPGYKVLSASFHQHPREFEWASASEKGLYFDWEREIKSELTTTQVTTPKASENGHQQWEKLFEHESVTLNQEV